MSKQFNMSAVKEPTKVTLNDQGDYILIDQDDIGLFDRFADFIAWLDAKMLESEKKGKAYEKKYKKGAIYEENEETVIDSLALLEACQMRTQINKDVVNKLDDIFGQDVIKKYFRSSYEISKDFIPDDLAILDFIEQITPILNEVFADRRKKIDTKYNSNRKGGKGNKYRTKEQLIADYKE